MTREEAYQKYRAYFKKLNLNTGPFEGQEWVRKADGYTRSATDGRLLVVTDHTIGIIGSG